MIPLEDVDPAIFNLFIEWLYTQRLPASDEARLWGQVAATSGLTSVLMLQLQLYVFANRFQVPLLRRTLNRMIIYWSPDSTSPSRQVIYAFANLPSTDPILDFFVDIHFVQWELRHDKYWHQEDLFSKLPHEFLLRFMHRVGEWRRCRSYSLVGKLNLDSCSYHEHESEEDKHRCRYQSFGNGKPCLRRVVHVADAQKDMGEAQEGADDAQ